MQEQRRTMDTLSRVFVIGAAAGGTAAVQSILRGLPADFPAAVLIALHPRHEHPPAANWLDGVAIPVHPAVEGLTIMPGCAYLSPSDRHLELTADLRLSLALPTPGLRPIPWVDRLFLSVVAACGARTVGVILTGADADGAQGMRAIHDAGGLGIVQEPSDAVDPSMPLSSLRIDHPAYCLPLREISTLLNSLAVQ